MNDVHDIAMDAYRFGPFKSGESIPSGVRNAYKTMCILNKSLSFTYQSLQTGFFSGQLNASLNSLEFAMVSCDRSISPWILQQCSDKSKLTMIRADLGACGSL